VQPLDGIGRGTGAGAGVTGELVATDDWLVVDEVVDDLGDADDDVDFVLAAVFEVAAAA